MMTFRRVKEQEVQLARDLHNRFTAQDKSMERVRSWYEEVPCLFLFAVDRDEIIGVCTGRPRGEREVSLAGIGIESDRRGEGIGTRLVKRFEENAAEAGIRRITVASAGGKVDDFYLGNGFNAAKILVMNPSGEPGDYNGTDFDIEWARNEDGSPKCYIDITEYNPAVLETVRNVFDDDHPIYIMAKELPVR